MESTQPFFVHHYGVKLLLIKALYKCVTFVPMSLTGYADGPSASSATVHAVILKAFHHVIWLGAVRFISEFISG